MRKERTKRSAAAALWSYGILFAGYLLIRYALFDLHGMKDWLIVLLIVCLAAAAVSLILKAEIVSLVTAFSYTGSFLAALYFRTITYDEIYGTSDNLWIVWTCILAACMISAVIIERYLKKKH